MQATIEKLGALERRVDLAISTAAIEKEFSARLTRLARTLKLPGFRPGKVPLKMVASSHGPQLRSEVLTDKIGEAFGAAVGASGERVAGQPRVEAKGEPTADELTFVATFDVFPEIALGDLGASQVQRAACAVGDAEIDQTIEIMRKQRTQYEPTENPARTGDRVQVDFVGTLEGVPFDGGTARDFSFVVGEGRMLPEFETAVVGLTAAQTKAFDMTFPADYRARNLADKSVQFEVTVKAVEQAILPAIDAEFARMLGVPDGNLETMRAEVRSNLEREVRARLKGRTQTSVMNALLAVAKFEVPKSLVAAEQEELAQMARKDMEQRGLTLKDAPLGTEVFAGQAERRVRLGLLMSELVRKEKLQAQQAQIRRAIEEIAESYERPAEVVHWYLGDRERVAQMEAMVVEENVVDWVLRHAQVVDTPVAFEELMGRSS